MTRTLLPVFRFLFSAAVAMALTACAANSENGVPAAAAASRAGVAPQAVIQNDAGEFSGSIQDSSFGTGTVTASLAQDEHVVGGYLTATYGSKSFTHAFTALTQTGLSLNGAEVATIDFTVCSFGMSATYNANSHVLKGTYKAFHGCSGESGSFAITKGCYYPRKGLFDAVTSWKSTGGAAPDHGLTQC